MSPNFPNLMKMFCADPKISKPSKVSTRRTTTRHIVKLPNDKEKILKAAVDKQLRRGATR